MCLEARISALRKGNSEQTNKDERLLGLYEYCVVIHTGGRGKDMEEDDYM
jgi:hypothetical protein